MIFFFHPFILLLVCFITSVVTASERPNILIAISDDQSYPHCSAYGSKMVNTPAFDRVAREGALFNNAFCASPGCSPSRAAFLTGKNTWQIEHAGTHASSFSSKLTVFPDQLQSAGYHVGYTGKGWAPGNFKAGGRTQNPAGKSYGGKGGYAAGFEKFLDERPGGKPFCFWFGSNDPHRGYVKGSGLKKGKTLEQAEVPGFLPDTQEIRSDLLDYAFEVERFDDDLAKFLTLLEKSGELDNTLIIVTSDNGMPFPRAKANCYEYGIHMPLAVSWKSQFPGGQTVDSLVSFTDLTATIYEASGVPVPDELAGSQILTMLQKKPVTNERPAIFSARERHSSSRYNTLSYPQRCIRTNQYLYIRNFKPERWPAGPAQSFSKATYAADGTLASSTLGAPFGAYHDIDGCPTLDFLVKNRDKPEIGRFLDLAVALRPAVEFFDIVKDPYCLENLAGKPNFAAPEKLLKTQLMDYLKETGDPRVTGDGDIWETYPRYSPLRWFPKPEWAEKDSAGDPKVEWLDAKRPKAKD